MEDLFYKATSTTDAIKDEKTFQDIILKGANKSTLARRIPKIYNAMPIEALQNLLKHLTLRKSNPIDMIVNEHWKRKWSEHLTKCGPEAAKLWATIKTLSCGSNKQPGNIFQQESVQQPKETGLQF